MASLPVSKARTNKCNIFLQYTLNVSGFHIEVRIYYQYLK
jgi:hypothetical protein